MQEVTRTILKKWIRPGDRNPNVKVYGIVDNTGKVTETCGNYGGFNKYPDPIGDWHSIVEGQTYTYGIGNKVSYQHDTFLGISK